MKKNLWLAMFSVLVVCSALAVAAQSGWKEYVYAEDGFAISAPIQPTVQTESKDTPIGSVDAHNYMVDLGNNTVVGVNATDFKMGQGIDSKLILAATKAGLAESLQGKIVSEKEISLGSEPGLELELVTDSTHLRFRYFFIDGKLFALMSTAPLAKPFAPETTRIFDSFRLVAGKSK
jgi:hypothetical protein